MSSNIDVANPCGYCKVKNSEVLYPTDDIFGNSYNINRCLSCKAYFLAPYPDYELLAKAYGDDYYGEGKEKFDESWIERLLDRFRNRRANLVKKYIPKTGKVLDIGCGNGRFLGLLNKTGTYEIYGLEMEGGSAERAVTVPNIELKIGALTASDYLSEYFDAITLFHVFEHLSEPKKYLEIISDIIRPNGILVISIPNIASWQAKLFKGRWFHMDAPRHLFFFSPKDLKQHLARMGFELIKEKHFNLEYNPYGTQQSILNCLLKKREVLYEALKGNKQYTREYSKLNLFFQQLFFKLTGPLFIAFDGIESSFRKGGTVEFVFRKTTTGS